VNSFFTGRVVVTMEIIYMTKVFVIYVPQ